LICRVILGTFSRGKYASYEALNTVFVSTGCRHSITYAIVTFRKVRDGTEYTYGQMHVCRRQSISNPKSNALQRDRPHHDRPATCVVAQQYSSATTIVLRIHARNKKEIFGARFKALATSLFQPRLKLQ